VLQFLEKFLSQKTGKQIEEPNISAWRRVVCGDLTSTFRPYQGEKIELPRFLSRNEFIEEVHKAKFKKEPTGYRALTNEEIHQVNVTPSSASVMPRQEKGMRRSCPLPYQLYADGGLTADRKTFELKLASLREMFGAKTAGSPFNVYAPGRSENDYLRSYAVAPGDELKDQWELEKFANGEYHIAVHGPNGFLREFIGDRQDPIVEIRCDYRKGKKKKLVPGLEIIIKNTGSKSIEIEAVDLSYGQQAKKQQLQPGADNTISIDLSISHCWYDISLKVLGNNLFSRRLAGRVETGQMGFTDPAIGQL
jgi:phospholipase C